MRFARVTLGIDHYMGYLIGPDGIIGQIDNQEGWDGKTQFVDNPIYARCETMYGAGLNRVDYTFTRDQWAAMQAWIATWAKASGPAAPAPAIDYAALAKAVNDDAAKRLAQ